MIDPSEPRGAVMSGKRAIITGGGSGIGRATAILFAHEGARVALVGRRRDLLDEVAAEIEARESSVLVLPADVSDEVQIGTAFATVEEQWGGLDACVAVAGVERWQAGDDRVDRLELTTWREIIDVNLTGMFLTLKYAVRSMLKTGAGAIVVTGSPTGLTGIGMGEDAYSASKAGCHGLARVVANEVARDGIRVNVVVPGFIDTPINERYLAADPESVEAFRRLIPMGRIGRADEVAALNLWLCSDASSYATGGYFVVDGGMLAV